MGIPKSLVMAVSYTRKMFTESTAGDKVSAQLRRDDVRHGRHLVAIPTVRPGNDVVKLFTAVR
jgi:hypothetical protein